MNNELWAGLSGAFLTLMAAILALPKIRAEARRLDAETPKARAEARKADAEADDKIVARLYREIERLDRSFDELAKEFAEFKREAVEEKHELEAENKHLRTEVTRLKLRVQGLEDILRVKPLTEQDKALLNELDRKTAKRGKP